MYEKEFLNLFGKHKKEIENISINADYIDISKIAKIYGLSILNENDYKERFSLASKIGNIVLKENGILFEINPEDDFSEIKKEMNITCCNKFAADLLMPYSLVIKVLEDVIAEKGLSTRKVLYDEEIEKITKIAADRLKVTYIALNFKMNNLNLLNKI